MPEFLIRYVIVSNGQRVTTPVIAENPDEAERIARKAAGEPIHVLNRKVRKQEKKK